MNEDNCNFKQQILTDEIMNVIDRHVRAKTLTYVDVIGVLECIKMQCFESQKEHEDA